jgi:two-component system cell cycle sensor histidine kinase/response regulator CckA
MSRSGEARSGPVVGETSLTILVVEDDASVRSVVSEMLDGPNRRILVAASAADALSFASSTTQLDLLVTDVVLPHISGHRIAKLVRAFHPELPVLYISGWYEHPQFPQLDGETILQKPFSVEELESAVSSALLR